MDAPEVLHRRARLRELIEKRFGGRQIDLINHIQDRTDKRPNQGELSALVNDNGNKSFGEKKGWSLAPSRRALTNLSRNWFDLPLGSALESRITETAIEQPVAAYITHPSPEIVEMVRIMEGLDVSQRKQCLSLVQTALQISPQTDRGKNSRTGT